MTAPKWATALLRRLAPTDGVEDVLGDLEETHRRRVQRRGRFIGQILTALDAMDMAVTLIRRRTRERRAPTRQAPPDSKPTASGRTNWASWLDFKLGFRMLIRYPGLTVVGGLAIAFAVWVGAGTFEFIDQLVRPTLPLDEGSRVVGIRLWDQSANRAEPRALHDFLHWREHLESVESLGAYNTLERNLILGDGSGEPVEVAEMSASGFTVARVPPLIGRTLDMEDERAGAPPVVVIGHDVWLSRLSGDTSVVGSTVRLGDKETTVVGVMPPGFRFPYAHSLWVPLRLSEARPEPLEGPTVAIFGRLAPGVGLDEAEAELTALGVRAAADSPDTQRHLTPQVMPYAQLFFSLPGIASMGLTSINLFVVVLLVLVSGNVALLMFARAAGRETEIVVRSALGATRGRIVSQLLAEALVLAGVAAIVGIAAARVGLEWWLGAFEGLVGDELPFWFRDTLAPTTMLYAAGLTVLGAVVAGVTPGLKVTRGLQARLQQVSQRGGRIQFGGVWTAVIVSQVAVTVALPVFGFFVRRDAVQIESLDVGFVEQEYLSALLEMDRDPLWTEASFLERFDLTVRELEDRLAAEPAVVGMTFANRFPGMYHPHRLIELDEGGAAPLNPTWPGGNCSGACVGYRVSSASVDQNFFSVFDAPILSGRGFRTGDFQRGPGVVIVNQSFVERVMGGRSPIGRRLRYTYLEEWGGGRPPGESMNGDPGPWLEIVGVVRDMGTARDPDPKVSAVYHPLPESGTYPVRVALHLRGDAEPFAPRLRAIATVTDPTLRLDNVLALSDVRDAELRFYAFWFWLIVLVSAVAMLLSLTGIYAVMSFTVSRRTREIGVRVALGSSHGRIALVIFRRPLTQVAFGVVAGTLLSGLLSYAILGGGLWPTGALLVVVYASLMMGVCLLACVVPTRRALGVEPTEALKADG